MSEIDSVPSQGDELALTSQPKSYNISRALLAVVLLPAILIGITYFVTKFLGEAGGGFDRSLTFFLSSSSFLLAAIIYITMIGKLKNIFSFLKLRGFKWRYIAIGLAGSVATYILAILVGIVIILLSGGLDNAADAGTNNTSETITGLAQSHSILLLGFLIAILAPVCEEIFFRGAMLGSIVQESDSRLLKFGAVVVVSVVFALFHMQEPTGTVADIMAMVTPGLVGLTASLLTLWYNSLYPAIFTHVFYNGFVLLILAGMV